MVIIEQDNRHTRNCVIILYNFSCVVKGWTWIQHHLQYHTCVVLDALEAEADHRLSARQAF